MNTLLSIIIPCFNSENTLEWTLESIYKQNFQDWEAIIVNDGSTDSTEAIAIHWANKDKRFKYFAKQNEGLGKTRNFAIKKAQGIYILPLDSDNKVEQNYANEAINIFKQFPEIGVVYGHAEYFGDRVGVWEVDDFNLEKLLIRNYIDACAIYKKSLWDLVGGYDEEMPYQGHEDWEFWLALGVLNIKFHHLKKIVFKYYVSENSMIRSFSTAMSRSNQDYIVRKYNQIYYNQYAVKTALLNKFNEQPFFAIKYYVKKIVKKYVSIFKKE